MVELRPAGQPRNLGEHRENAEQFLRVSLRVSLRKANVGRIRQAGLWLEPAVKFLRLRGRDDGIRCARRDVEPGVPPALRPSARFWTAPAKRSDDGAFERRMAGGDSRTLRRPKAVSRFACHRRFPRWVTWFILKPAVELPRKGTSGTKPKAKAEVTNR